MQIRLVNKQKQKPLHGMSGWIVFIEMTLTLTTGDSHPLWYGPEILGTSLAEKVYILMVSGQIFLAKEIHIL